MPYQKMTNWGAWTRTHNALWISLAENLEGQQAATSDDEREEYQLNINKIHESIIAHNANGKRMIDLAIADQDLVDEITAEAAVARNAAQEIQNIAATVDQLTDLVEQLATLAAKFVLL